MDWLLAYDVVSDRRRGRFHKRLKRLMVPVQKSVFEGRLGPKELARVEALICRELDLETDSIRLYPLGAGAREAVRVYGVASTLPDPDEPVVL